MSGRRKNLLGIQAVGRNVWETTALKVGVFAVVILGLVADLSQVLLDGGVLVPGAREVVGETAGGGIPRNFGADVGGSSNCSHVGASGWEDGVELGSDAVASLAGRANT